MDILTIGAITIGLLLGWLICFLTFRRKVAESKVLPTARERIATLEAENRNIPKLESAIQKLDADLLELTQDLGEKKAVAREVDNLRAIRDAADKELKRLGAENAQLREARASDERMIEEMKEFRERFQSMSKQALTENRKDFLEIARESMTPLQTKIREFEEKVELVYRTEAAERNSLRGEIKNLVELNQQISKEASNLALALKGDTKKQGNWGELILEKALEFSGLRKGEEYKLQSSFRDEQGERKIPDAVIYLPDKKHIIIDAKVSLKAYDKYVACQSDEERSAALIEHIASVKNHIKNLSEQRYPSLPELDSPDFTLLFMPIEPSFGLAWQADLFPYAWERNIMIVSPSTLIPNLRTIASIWKQERQTRNALDIADRAGKMYDKFVGFIDDLIVVGKKMSDAKSGYDEAMKKLSSGPGNLVRQSEQLKDMGAKATKQLPPTLLDRAIDVQSNGALPAGSAEELALTA